VHASPAAINSKAIHLRNSGRLDSAIALLREGIEQFPTVAELRRNLGQMLYEAGDNDGAASAYIASLGIEPDGVAALLALYELYQILGDRCAAIEYQRRALALQRAFLSFAPNAQRSVLVLCAPGDWQANIPVDFLLDRATTSVHKLYIVDEPHLQTDRLPPHDVVWNTIAESPSTNEYLELADRFRTECAKPFLNLPSRVLATARLQLPETLRDSGATVAPIVEVSRNELLHGGVPFPYPVVVRPVGSHAGHGLERIGSLSELDAYLQNVSVERYYVNPFIDYRSSDGYFRKYRVMFVDGEPYPCHLAISPRWMIHYYNAAMAENAWMRDEEARFLANLRLAFDGPRYETLLAIARAVGLDYFGIDCSIAPDGALLVFEADPAMLVHTSDPIELYPYKHEYIPRIYGAVTRMLDKRRRGG
jgi:tetratricopeptide (TPR) repeat protein